MNIETISQITDSVVAILSFALIVYARNLLAIFRNGRMEMSFKLFTIAPIFLAISNIYGFLSDFNLLPDLYSKWNLQIDDIASILFILTLFLGFFELRKVGDPKKLASKKLGRFGRAVFLDRTNKHHLFSEDRLEHRTEI